MQVHRGINNLPLFKNAVITIGTFDGVHTGHLQIISQLKEEAKKIEGESVLITFDPHPRTVVGLPDDPAGKGPKISLLNTLNEKTELLRKQKIDHLVIVPFTKEFSEQSAEKYIKEFLVKNFRPHTIIIGYDHHFGKERKGNYKLLEAYADEFNYLVKEIPEHVLNHVAISSTKIREAILNCDIQTAGSYLGYDYFFEGKVVEGDKIGRSIGYPTANLVVNDKNKLIPGNGVYAVEVSMLNDHWSLGNETFVHLTSDIIQRKGMMNIGVRPTIGGTKRMIEVNIFDFNESIYGEKMRVFVKKYLRPEEKFNGLEELRLQIDKDKINAMEALSEP